MQVVYRRLPSQVERYTQEVLHDGLTCKISLMLSGRDSTPLRIGEVDLQAGGVILWFVFPGRPYEIASVYDPQGEHLGTYTNFIRPPKLETGVWQMTDLYLDVWQPAGGSARLLDEADFEEALRDGVLEADEARGVRAEADAVLRAARGGRWPPGIVGRNGLDAVESLRFRRDAPGTFFANRVVGRLIAFGIYSLGAISLISIIFAAFTGAFLPGPSPARLAWLISISAAAALLLVAALAGRLPATQRPRLEEAVTERILFIGTLVSGAAILLYPDSTMWRGALAGVYATLALFLAIFAVSRVRHDRRFPVLAVAGLLVCALALLVLL